jgi:hypothetical protein
MKRLQYAFFYSIVCMALIGNGTIFAGESVVPTLPNPILFVTQIPIPLDTSTITTVFANHLARTRSCGRGGDLCILYPDGTLKNLTALAGYGNSGMQGANSIAVREPSMHWSGTKAIFSMVVGAPSSQSDTTQFFWQMYEVSGLGELETPVITHLTNQPQYNNINPIYGTDGRIIFSSDKPHNGAVHLYPQNDEYRGELTNSGLWSLDPSSGNVKQLDHAPSGDFRPFIDSYDRLIFTRWDHLQRDSQADVDIIDGNKFGSFNYSDESAGAAVLANNRTEYYPEPQSRRTDLLAGMNVNGFEFNHFIPWQMNEDGTEGETMNHVGRHDLQIAFSKSFTNDPNLLNFSPSPTRTNQNSIFRMFQVTEDPTTPGKYYGVDCGENGTHGAGQIIVLHGAPSLDAQDMYVDFITDRATSFSLPENGVPNFHYTGHYRNPLPLSNGTLLCVHTDTNHVDKNLGTYTNPISRYAFRIKTLKVQSGTLLMADMPITTGISKSVSYWSDSGLVSYSGALWELDPIEVKSKSIPSHRVSHIGGPELQVMAEEGVDTTTFRNYLSQHNLAVIISRNITNRNTDDKQQPFYLKVHNSSTQSPNPTGKVYDVAHLQLFEADHIRGYGLVNGNVTAKPGRRVLPVPLNDTSVHNPANPSGPVGSVQLGSDGSMAAFIPAHRAMAWQLTDSGGTPVVRERFWVTFQPGEVRTCASCHGSNGEAAVPKQIIPQNKPEAFRSLLQYWKAVLNPQSAFQYSVLNSWNMISVPRTAPDWRKTVLFPTALSNAFSYFGNYQQQDTLKQGNGYWIKFGSDQLVQINGAGITRDTVNVTTGWNMIGSIANAIDTGAIVQVPPGIVLSHYFGYSGAYATTDSIYPSKAYWVKVSQDGQLVLSSAGGLQKHYSVNNLLSSLNTLTITDAIGQSQKLYFGSIDRNGASRFALPPPPPEGSFDARFSSNQMVETIDQHSPRLLSIAISASSYPITFQWDIRPNTKNIALNLDKRRIDMNNSGSIQVDAQFSRVSVSYSQASLVPEVFSLEQNYPNPFNPTTRIQYTLPVDAFVRLTIFTILGQEVATLVNSQEGTGYKSVEWNGKDLTSHEVSSGMYYYRLEATSTKNIGISFIETKKMLLLH